MQWRIYGEWAMDEASDAVRSAFSRTGHPSHQYPNSATNNFVNDGPSRQQNPTAQIESVETVEERTQIRRAQVRRAQVKHRQRKANHVKQLELDASQLRDMISQTEGEVYSLSNENEMMKATLRELGLPIPVPHLAGHSQQGPALPSTSPDMTSNETLPDFPQYPEANFGTSSVMAPPTTHSHAAPPQQLVKLSVDRNISSPRLHVGMSSVGPSASVPQVRKARSGSINLTPEQEYMAINFILSLEHGCWSHFGRGDFHNHEKDKTREKGHALMASSYYMSSAPDHVYEEKFTYLNPLRKSPELEWQANELTLDTLHGLAESLNPSDLEITPVQAWFELASRYPIDVLLQQNVLDTLSKEFKGTVNCVIFGAAVERQAFESIVYRVLGPPTSSLVEQMTLE